MHIILFQCDKESQSCRLLEECHLPLMAPEVKVQYQKQSVRNNTKYMTENKTCTLSSNCTHVTLYECERKMK